MSYLDLINGLICGVNSEIIDFSQERTRSFAPTQVSSEFLTNKEQGDWAEKTLIGGINKNSTKYIAVKYGRDDNIIAGEEGFKEFYKNYQDELDNIGKRPDILIFDKSDFPYNDINISKLDLAVLDKLVPLAKCGIEVRSSAFIISHYENYMQNRMDKHIASAISIKDTILNQYYTILNCQARRKYLELLKSLNIETIHVIDFKVPGWRSSSDLVQINTLLKQLKSTIKKIQNRDYLSITPKVEDLKVVYKWIETFNVPHYYFQVFFDKVYGISFAEILKIISNPNNEGSIFSVESDTKNQNKTTIKIKSSEGIEIATKIDEPSHRSVRKEIDRGRLLYYVAFDGGTAYLDIDNLKHLLNINGQF